MHLAFLVPSPEPPGGGSGFNAGMVPALRALGHQVDIGQASLPPLGIPVIDGLLLPDFAEAMPALIERDAVAVVHHVSAAAGRDAVARQAVRAVEQRLLPQLRRVIATSQSVAERLEGEFGLVGVRVLTPGLPVLPRSEGSAGACALLSVGVLTPRKGHDRLLRAMARLTDLDWSLVIAGDGRRDPVHTAGLFALIDELGLQDRVTLLPDPAALEPLWRQAGLFVLDTAWEGHPAAIAEALRRGLPVVAPLLPAVEALVPAGAGVLYPAGDAATFGKCLRRAICDAALRADLAAAAWQAGQALPGWEQQALLFETILKG